MATPPNERVRPLVREYAKHGGDQRDHRPWPRPLDPSEDAIDVRGVFFQDGSSNDTDVCVWREGSTLYFRDKNMAVGASYSLADLADKSLTTNAQHGNRGGGSLHALATQSVHGFMSATDKSRIDSLWSNHGGKTYLLSTGKAADADKLDGQDGAWYRDLANSTGIISDSRFSRTPGNYRIDPRPPDSTTQFHSTLDNPTLLGLSLFSDSYVFDGTAGNAPGEIEYTTDGTNWLPYTGATPIGEHAVRKVWSVLNDNSANMVIQNGWKSIRMTWEADSYRYWKYIYMYQSSAGNQYQLVLDKEMHNADGSYSWVNVGTYDNIDGWPSHILISHVRLAAMANPAAGDGRARKLRITLNPTWVNANDIFIYHMKWMCTYPASMSYKDKPLFMDYDKNVSFYGSITVPSGKTISVGGNPVWHSGNDGAGSGLDADLLDGQHADSFLGKDASAVSLKVHDTRNDNPNPSGFQSVLRADFKRRDTIGLPEQTGGHTYAGLLTLAPWVNLSGGPNYQIAFHKSSLIARPYIRFGEHGGDWTDWSEIWHAGNDGSGSGLDADLLDGQHGSYYLNPANLSAAVPINKGGTGATSKTAAFNALSPTTTGGDFIYRSGSNDVRLPGNTTATKQFLSMTSAVPSWVTLAASDLPGHSHVIGDLPVASSGESSSTKVVRADDSRLSNARTPTAHTHSISHVNGLRDELDSLAGQISAGYGEMYVETGDATGVTIWDDQGNQVGTQTFADKFSIGLSDWVFDHLNGKADGESHALLRPDLNWQSTPAGTTANWSPAQYLNGTIRTPYILAESGAPDVAGDGPKGNDVEYSLLTFAMRNYDNAPVDQLAFADGSIWYRRGLKGSPWPSDWKEVADCDWVGRNYQAKSETLGKIHALGHSSTPATGFLRKKGQHDWEIVAEHNHNVLISTVANGASAIGFKLSTPSYTTSGAKLLSLLNGSTEKFSIDKDGVVSASDFKVGSTSVSLEGHTHSYVSISTFNGHVNGTSNKHQIPDIVGLKNELTVRPVGNVVAGDPTNTDDLSKGYIPGSLWVNKDTDVAFVCVRADLNNAVWTPISGGGSGGGDPFVSRTKTIATINPSYNSKYSDSFFHFPVTAQGWTTEFLNDNPGEFWIYRHFELTGEEALVRFGTFLVDGLYRSTHMRLEFSYDYGAAWQHGPVLEFWPGSAHEQGPGYMISDWFPLVLEPDMLFRIVGWSEEDDYEIICGTISIELCLIKSNH